MSWSIALIRSYLELGDEEEKSAVLVKVYGIDRDEFVGYMIPRI